MNTSKSFNFTKIVSAVVKGVNEIKQNSNLKIVEEKNWRRVRRVLVYIVGGISFVEYAEIKACADASNVQLVYTGDRIAKAAELMRD